MPLLSVCSWRRYAVVTVLVLTFAALIDHLLVRYADRKDFTPPAGWVDSNPDNDEADYPHFTEPTHRLDISNLGGTNEVLCWPSVGGILVARSLTAVELDFLSLSRFSPTPRSYNVTEEDAFCQRLRLLGAHWYSSYTDYEFAHLYRLRQPTPDETQILHIGWPATSGVWVMRQENEFDQWDGVFRMRNAYTMEERCKALEMSGATFYENPEECKYVKPLLEGFGNKESENIAPT